MDHDPAVVKEMREKRTIVFKRNDPTDLALYGAVVEQDRAAQTVARQVGLKPDEVRRRAEYVREQMKEMLGESYKELLRE